MPKLSTTYLPAEVYSPDVIRQNEGLIAKQQGLSLYQLMETAGLSVFSLLQKIYPKGANIAVFCGSGNNAGDAYVVARLAKEAGWQVSIVLMPNAKALKGDAATAQDRFYADFKDAKEYTHEHLDLDDFDILIDGILGTGLDRKLDESWQAIITKINQSSSLKVSIDIPSGLNANTGMPCGAAVNADHTMTFIGLKPGLLTAQGPEICGTLHFADLAIAETFAKQVPACYQRIELNLLRSKLVKRSRYAHKHDFGHVVCIGGNKGMAGAIRLSAEACLRTGAGLVSVITHPDNLALVTAGRPELMVHACQSIDDGLENLLARADVIVIGPGLGQDAWANELLSYVNNLNTPTVIDADGLRCLANLPVRSPAKPNRILTPHVGEGASLLKCDKAAIELDRITASKELALHYGGVAVLKGCGSLVSSADVASICSQGNPGMATAGMGDILTGVIAGVLAQLPAKNEIKTLFDATSLAVCIHAEAGDLAAQEGERGLLASDLFPYLRLLVNEH